MDNDETIWTVVPCYNEARRLDLGKIDRLTEGAYRRLILVDDGSTDETATILDRFAAERGGVAVLHLPRNVGKAEAVRAGLLAAISEHASIVGYLDADMATSPDEYLRLCEILLSHPHADGVLAARVALLGRDIQRSRARHYLGRVFATCTSVLLGVRAYDTQCGAKVFRVSTRLRRAIDAPFISRWAFDVELLGRLHSGDGACRAVLIEEPLRSWVDVEGSKLTLHASARAVLDLGRIWWSLRDRSDGHVVVDRSAPNDGAAT
jgi:glycosyltransferase involved in cell wall biosynthesis